MTAEIETLSLPNDYSFGRITVYLPGEPEPRESLDARGTIQFPRGANIFLDVSQEVCDDLRRIHLVPQRLLANGVSFLERKLDNTNFRELLLLQPQCLVITFCNGIRLEQLRQLDGLISLEYLNLGHTPLDTAQFSWLSQFPKLKTLILSGTGADDSCVPYLASLRALEELDLARCKMSDAGVQALWKVANLVGVNLGDCHISDKALSGLGFCFALHSLALPNTRVSDNGVEIIVTEVLRANQQLKSLVLRSCDISDKALVRLASLKQLALLDLYATEVTAKGAAFLKKSLPGCRIFVGRDKGGGPGLWQVNHT